MILLIVEQGGYKRRELLLELFCTELNSSLEKIIQFICFHDLHMLILFTAKEMKYVLVCLHHEPKIQATSYGVIFIIHTRAKKPKIFPLGRPIRGLLYCGDHIIAWYTLIECYGWWARNPQSIVC